MPNDTPQLLGLLPKLLAFGLLGGPSPLEGTDAVLTDSQWQKLFEESRRQGVVALLYDAILQLPQPLRPSRRVLFHFTTFVDTVEDDNRKREAALAGLSSLMTMPPVVVKGSSMQRFYPVPSHRECGDNDLYTGLETEQVNRIVESMGETVDRSDPRHSSFYFGDIPFECHNYLLYDKEEPEWRIVDFQLSVDDSRQPFRTLADEDHAYFIAKHIEHHAVFFHTPVTLRSLVDWALLLCAPGFDYERLQELKKGSDVDVFADMLSQYCNSVFGTGLPYDARRLAELGLTPELFRGIYIKIPDRHRWALVRVSRRSGKYLRYRRAYKAIYGQSPFRRFYFHNVKVAAIGCFR